MESEKVIHILHFNDVYNLISRKKEPVGGAARFITAAREYEHLNPLVLFSGDIYSPSKLGQIMKGKQMVPFLERFKIDVACVGNHDLDYGVDRFVELKGKTDFPWLLTNVFDSQTNEPLADALDHIIIEHEGVKIGLIGLAEVEWLDAVVSIEEDDYIFEDFVKSGRKWLKKLREEEKCDLVIALTHMRMPNDKRLASKVPGFDLILGGHDHMSAVININDAMLCKSGSDFREFSILKVRMNCSPEALKNEDHESVINYKTKNIISAEKVEVTGKYEPDESMNSVIEGFWEDLNVKMEYPAGVSGVDLDARFDQIRTKETNIANFVADVVRFTFKSDVAILNSGSFRTDEIIPAGVFRWRDIDTLFPIADDCVVIRVSGAKLLQALENGVSEVPKLEGRFPSLSGVRFKYDPTKPPMSRILDCEVGGEPIHMKKLYSVATKDFLALGKDGYDALANSEMITDDEEALTVNIALVNFLKLMVRKNNRWFSDKHNIVDGALGIINNTKKDFVTKDEKGEKLRYDFYKIYPIVDGRITDITADNEVKE